MDYQQTLDFLYRRLSMFTRDGATAYKEDLHNTLALCARTGNPQDRLTCIHIAGTNGKGSSSHALAAILQQSGYKTGLYTSPHLVDFRERIRINGQVIPEEWVVNFVRQHRDDLDAIQPSFFETTVAMAFTYFVEESVDIAVIETGLGGRLDSTNVVTPEVSLITNIGWDHADMLGPTLERIAMEKAGIIKPAVPVVISEYQDKLAPVIEGAAAAVGAPIYFASRDYQCQSQGRSKQGQDIAISYQGQLQGTYTLDLLGSYQSKNLGGVLAVVDRLREQGWELPESAVRTALSAVQSLTGLRGRWEILGEEPLLVCDTGHNQDGWSEILHNISLTPHRALHMVLGVMRDKDLSKMLPQLPPQAQYYFCQTDLPRALPAPELAAIAAEYRLIGQAYSDVHQALESARAKAHPDDLLFVGGSTFIVGDLLSSFPLGDPVEPNRPPLTDSQIPPAGTSAL